MSITLVVPINEEKVWAALMLLSDTTRWVPIYTLQDFLVAQQRAATAIAFDPKDVSVRFALRPTMLAPEGWGNDIALVAAVASAIDHGLVEQHRDDEGLNHFRAKPTAQHTPWGVQNANVPVLKSWL